MKLVLAALLGAVSALAEGGVCTATSDCDADLWCAENLSGDLSCQQYSNCYGTTDYLCPAAAGELCNAEWYGGDDELYYVGVKCDPDAAEALACVDDVCVLQSTCDGDAVQCWAYYDGACSTAEGAEVWCLDGDQLCATKTADSTQECRGADVCGAGTFTCMVSEGEECDNIINVVDCDTANGVACAEDENLDQWCVAFEDCLDGDLYCANANADAEASCSRDNDVYCADAFCQDAAGESDWDECSADAATCAEDNPCLVAPEAWGACQAVYGAAVDGNAWEDAWTYCGTGHECLAAVSAVTTADDSDITDGWQAANGNVCLSSDWCGADYVYGADTVTLGDCPIPEEGGACDNESYFCYAGSAYDAAQDTQCVATTSLAGGATSYACDAGSLCGTQDDSNCYECVDGSGGEASDFCVGLGAAKLAATATLIAAYLLA